MRADSTCRHLHPHLHPRLHPVAGALAAIGAMNRGTCTHSQWHLQHDLHPCPVSIRHGQVQVFGILHATARVAASNLPGYCERALGWRVTGGAHGGRRRSGRWIAVGTAGLFRLRG